MTDRSAREGLDAAARRIGVEPDAFDAALLRSAARILELRTSRPQGFVVSIITEVLRRVADETETGKRRSRGR